MSLTEIMPNKPPQVEVGVPLTYDVGFTVLSVFTSFAGCVTTLELLHRRTSIKGLYNWFLFIGACVAMGGSGIWSMHFIANRAIIIGNGESERQIVYSPGSTAISVFLPVFVLSAAFYFLGSNRSRAKPLYLVLAGILTGTAVCGMHYVGNAGIRNYHCHYKPANVAGAAVIAVAASLVALGIFFRLRNKWTDSWIKRALCALILTTAVCGMHWTAAVGTQYIEGHRDSVSGGTTRVQTVIVCAALSLSCCLVLLIIALYRGVRVRIDRSRAQQVVLACAYFDETGRIMLTQEGAFPCQKITDRYIEKDFGEDELSRTHPTFMWVFRASRDWSAVRDLIPGMIRYLESDQQARKYRPGRSSPTSDTASDVSLDFSNVFKQLFCVAANQLSSTLHEGLDELGVLFEEAVDTGTSHIFKTTKRLHRHQLVTALPEKIDVESNAVNIGRGKYLFLNRRLTKSRADRYASLGYRFASIDQVTDLVSRTMDVKPGPMATRLERMLVSVSDDRRPLPGVHLACLMVRASVHKSFDVLVPARTQNQLPSVNLRTFVLTPWHSQLLKRLEERPVRDVLDDLIREANEKDSHQDFVYNLHTAILELSEQIGGMEHMLNGTFSGKPVEVPCQSDNETDISPTCTLLPVRIMTNIHTKLAPNMAYVPLSFFSAQQSIEANHSQDKAAWARQVRMEFGYNTLISPLTPVKTPTSPWGPWSNKRSSLGLKKLRSIRQCRRDRRFGSTDGTTQRDSIDEESRIVKTVEVSLKEEKDGDTASSSPNTLMHSSIEDLDKLASPLCTTSRPNVRRGKSATGSTSDDNPPRDPFNNASKGRYVANIESGAIPSPPPPPPPFARSISAGRKWAAGNLPSRELKHLELMEMGEGGAGGADGDRSGGWVNEVFSGFRL